MEGFNNFEQGVLIACALASTLSLMWLAIIFSGACLRQIEVVHQLRRIADLTEHPPELIEEVRTGSTLGPSEGAWPTPQPTREVSSGGTVVDRDEDGGVFAVDGATVKTEERMVFGSMPDEERRARRKARRIEACNHRSAEAKLVNASPDIVGIICDNCNGVAPVIREEGQPPRLGDFE